MLKTLQKTDLREGYYYLGYVMQNYCVISENQEKIVALWDNAKQEFVYLESQKNIKRKSALPILSDLDNMDEISEGFVPIKEIIPKPEHIIE